MRFVLFMCLLLFASASVVEGAVIRLSGHYQGTNLFVQNPYVTKAKCFCTTNVYLNDKKIISNPTSTAYEIDLSHLDINADVNIRIYHREGCEPKVLNEHVIKSSSLFEFMKFDINDRMISWETKGEKKNGKYRVEQFINGHWELVELVNGKGSISEDFYQVDVFHYSGVNKFRVIYKEETGATFESEVVSYKSNKKPVRFYPIRVADEITFVADEKVLYEIHDMEDNKVLSGTAYSIDCTSLPGNEYYTLYFDNQKVRFLKKR